MVNRLLSRRPEFLSGLNPLFTAARPYSGQCFWQTGRWRVVNGVTDEAMENRVQQALAQHEVWQVVRDLKFAELDLLLSMFQRPADRLPRRTAQS